MEKHYNKLTGEKVFEEKQGIEEINRKLLEACKMANELCTKELNYYPEIYKTYIQEAISNAERKDEK